jgi:hypothetical protein
MSQADDEARVYDAFVEDMTKEQLVLARIILQKARGVRVQVKPRRWYLPSERTGNYNLRSAVRLGRTDNVVLPSFGEAVVEVAAQAGTEVDSDLLGKVMTRCLRHQLYQVTGDGTVLPSFRGGVVLRRLELDESLNRVRE